MKPIILFDGECNLCNHSVKFVIKRDKKMRFRFASLQSEVGQNLLRTYQVPTNTDSFILLQNKKAYDKSSAALRVCKHLAGFWKLFYFLLIIPKSIRDYFYNIIAKNRLNWFGRKKSCMLSSPELKQRFLE